MTTTEQKIEALPAGKKVAFQADHSDFRGRPMIAMQEICTTDELKSLTRSLKAMREALGGTRTLCEKISRLLMPDLTGAEADIRDFAKTLDKVAREALASADAE